ncbi:hypothetical protein COX69_02675 [Candidatus Falkowbacteria bacterium CG_4_10_14_0_2_um_filter_48_10]|uniref:Exonuclease domain-containing protein n=1 Tax=Candidatus Falkowbacteria bacterium CG23_combo_of_CG06-09_8_20_14_all_49_15 TaxID=1974572 RepID=A0A2G9ZLZ1_9BACT|nr:MAG: hypothetical protein COX22_00250 [Candidatus Falkowbacteria bacterium CG23_combo_of_CG06-09_8_20_14_all_49_15]PJA08299.1 MAG: hypothetical protein COX69_02675 [Candidatus Falkowbacteria bacterium CG_4_10_14_0_2_um_filter_48_10]
MFIFSDKYKSLAQALQIKKPLVIFDVETTGRNISADKIVALAYMKIWPEGRTQQAEYYFNPEVAISPESGSVHGITNSKVADQPVFKEKAPELLDIFRDCLYAGHNIISFDLPILRREFIRVGQDFNYRRSDIIDTRVIFQRLVPRTLAATYEYYCRVSLKDHNSAQRDVQAVFEILRRQMEKYGEMLDQTFLGKIHKEFSEEVYVDTTRKFYWRAGEAYFAFSEHRDQSLSQVAVSDPGYLAWMLESDFSEEVKEIVRQALAKRRGKTA